jgi:hypothetical protein
MPEPFEFVCSGRWSNGLYCIQLDSAYKRSYYAFNDAFPYWNHVVLNASGNPKRFRSLGAAIAHFQK